MDDKTLEVKTKLDELKKQTHFNLLVSCVDAKMLSFFVLVLVSAISPAQGK